MALSCTECGSRYFIQVHEVDEASGHKGKKKDNDPEMWKCSNCGQMLTVQDAQPRRFTEGRKKPMAMVDDGVPNPVEHQGGEGRR